MSPPRQDKYLDPARLRRFSLAPQPLFAFRDGGSSSGRCWFRIRTPDTRVRMRVAVVMLVGPDVTSFDPRTSDVRAYFRVTKVWAALADRTVQSIPAQNLVGTRAAPVTFPTDDGLAGHAFELETQGEEILGYVDVSGALTINNEGGRIMLAAAIGALEPMTEREWQAAVSNAQISTDPAININPLTP